MKNDGHWNLATILVQRVLLFFAALLLCAMPNAVDGTSTAYGTGATQQQHSLARSP